MSESVEVPFGADASETAVLLLAAAQELGLDAAVVATTEGAFLVPSEVNDKAFSTEKPAKKTASKAAKTKE